MNKEIIQQINKEIQEISNKNLSNLLNGNGIHEASEKLVKDIQKIGLIILKDNIETLDKAIKEMKERKERYKVDGKVSKSLIVDLGELKFRKTRYYDIKENEYLYLVDRYLKIESTDRMSDSVKKRILNEAIESTYRKGGKNASITVGLSKGTTKNIIDNIDEELIKVKKRSKVKKEVEYLYIDADEAHINIQEKGKRNKRKIY